MEDRNKYPLLKSESGPLDREVATATGWRDYEEDPMNDRPPYPPVAQAQRL